ncbi:hypothetical protein AAC387_Pa10g2153 [Persea americana]
MKKEEEEEAPAVAMKKRNEGKVEDLSKVQTLLFSATLPSWVKQIASRFLKPEKKTIDLVGNEKIKASTTVRHIALPCSHSARAQLIPDIVRCYSSGGRTIIFTETKNSCAELADLLRGARALHGDIQQSQREVTLAGFRAGKFLVLVATNVAARGLDINDVQLIIQCEPPRDVEAYIHRSGRTGRAGNTGVAVLLYEPKKAYTISKIERESGVKFEHISAPQPAEIARSAGLEAAEIISNVSDSVVPVFKSVAEQLLSSSGLPAIDLLAKALAKTAGYTEIKNRSLLTSLENYVTLLLQAGRPIYTPSFAFSVLRRFLPDEKVEQLKGLSLTADGKGAVFDVPAADVDLFIAGQENASMVAIEVPYIFCHALILVTITYPSIRYYWSAYKIFWYFYALFCTLLYFTYLGMLIMSLSPNVQVASILASSSYTLLNLFSGFLIPGPSPEEFVLKRL